MDASERAPQFCRLVGRLSTLFGIVAALMILAAVVITCQLIWVRSVMNESTIWQTEAVIYLTIGATLLGLGYVQKLRGHVNVDLVPLMLPIRWRRILAMIVSLATLAVAGGMTFYGFDMWYVAMERGWRSESVWRVPLWIPYLSMPVGFGLFTLQLVADLVATASGRDIPIGGEAGRG